MAIVTAGGADFEEVQEFVFSIKITKQTVKRQNVLAFPRNLFAGLLLTAVTSIPSHSAALQLDCTHQVKMREVQSDGSMRRTDRDSFSLDTETREGSVATFKGDIYDVETRFTADKIIVIWSEKSSTSARWLYRYDISRTNGSLLKFSKYLLPGDTESSQSWGDNYAIGGSCKKKTINTIF